MKDKIKINKLRYTIKTTKNKKFNTTNKVALKNNKLFTANRNLWDKNIIYTGEKSCSLNLRDLHIESHL